MPNDEYLKALSARLEVSLDYLTHGRTEDAVQLLRRMRALLPSPELRHLDAARNTHRNDPDA